MIFAMASDHAGFEMKEEIKKALTDDGHSIEDCGCYNTESCDYPDFAHKACKAILNNKAERGILICGTGLGMSYTANRYKGIRAALCMDAEMAEMARAHNDANILVLGARLIDIKTAKDILRVWMETPFDGGRHIRRIEKIDELEE
jgi:ribose 5-phosphate isomerase B